MKLIDILVEELPKRGGWDAKWHQCAQDGNGEVCFFTDGEINFRRSFDAWSIPSHGVARHDGKARLELLLADDYSETIITREQYEAALSAKNDGWIEWGGGKRPPVSTNTAVDVKFKNGNVQSGYPAGGYSWVHAWQDSNIIAYRLHQPQEAEQAEADDEADLNECIGQDAAPLWNGEGLPPVGCECEYTKQTLPGDEWTQCIVDYVGASFVVYRDCYGVELTGIIGDIKFRPIRSEEERKREEAVQALCDAGGGSGKVDEKAGYGSCWFDVYDAIAAGKIPGVKLDD